ncbi:MAG TPA: hypothetical protein VHA12_03545 [Candidatus Nanoarchaeia archaeon]|nr:hypothetical protein [Candidatus Nanoarchaeia archaeon]
MKYKLIFFIFLFLVSVQYSSACTPNYVCNSWGNCEKGIQTRNCTEIACGLPSNIERRLCTSAEDECKVKYQCSLWSQCSYLDKTEDILNSNIRFKGFSERACTDINNCADNFVEQKACEDSFKVKFVKIEQCGVPFLLALDENSNREVSEVNLNAWKQRRLDISFIQSNFTYCPSCYNSVQDNDEEGIDCGGSCKACVKETGISEKIVFISGSWVVSLILCFAFVFSSFFDRKTRIKYLIYRAYRALDNKERQALSDIIRKIKDNYKHLSAGQKGDLDKDLDRLYRRI